MEPEQFYRARKMMWLGKLLEVNQKRECKVFWQLQRVKGLKRLMWMRLMKMNQVDREVNLHDQNRILI